MKMRNNILIILAVGGVVVCDTMFKEPVYQAKTTVVIAKSDNTENNSVLLNDSDDSVCSFVYAI